MEEAICLISKTGCKGKKRERLAEMKENILTQGNEA
jgi:CRISPR/Cas system type I-B associated protein Csh2 (Cas7 group RAMP superfamily)